MGGKSENVSILLGLIFSNIAFTLKCYENVCFCSSRSARNTRLKPYTYSEGYDTSRWHRGHSVSNFVDGLSGSLGAHSFSHCWQIIVGIDNFL